MKLIVGLGNPGPEYSQTRHNVGFLNIDWLIKKLSAPSLKAKKEFKSLTTSLRFEQEELLLVQPQTYMNLSGDAVQAIVSFYKIELDDILILQDEVDLKFGDIKLQRNRGHAGNNGIRDITQKLGTADYRRIRIGVGRPENPHISVADYVLQKFSADEFAKLEEIFAQSWILIQNEFLKRK